MNKKESCFSCKYYENPCCMKDCACMAILHEENMPKICGNYVEGNYDQKELERTDYK